MVDGFLTYVSRTLARVYRAKPELLRSEEPVRLDDVLRFDAMEEVIAFLADRRVANLAYKSLDELADYVRRHLGFEMFPSDEARARAAALVELRNLIVHNGRIANVRFKARARGYQGAIGAKVPIGPDTLEEAAFLTEVASQMDELAAAKWGLPRDAALPTAVPRARPR